MSAFGLRLTTLSVAHVPDVSDHALASQKAANLDEHGTNQRRLARIQARAKQRHAQRTKGVGARTLAQKLDGIERALEVGEQVLEQC